MTLAARARELLTQSGPERPLAHVGLSAGFALALAGLLRLAASGSIPPAARGAAASCAASLLLSFVLPMTSAGLAASCDRPAWAARSAVWTAGSSAGLVVFALLFSRGGSGPTLASCLVIASCAFSFGALAAALAEVLRSRSAAASLAAAALLALESLPFWSGPLFRSAAGPSTGKFLVGASPLMASSMPWVSLPVWSFDPRTSPALYGLWVGTDVPVAYPSWVACAAGHILAGCVFLGFVAVRGALRRSRDRR